MLKRRLIKEIGMRLMTVKKLREIISEAPEDAFVLVPGHDHSYRDAYAEVTTALKEGPFQFCEDHGEQYTPEAEYGPRVSVVIIS